MRLLAAVRSAVASPIGRRGAIAVVVVVLHALALAGLMLTRIIDVNRFEPSHESVLTLVYLPPLAAKPASAKSGRKGKRPEQEPLPDYHWLSGPFARKANSNAITVRIPPYVANGSPHCPSPLKPGTKEWERRCPWLAKAQRPAENDGYEDFSLVPHDSPAFKMWEAEIKKRNTPAAVPCAYTRKEKLPGGPFESSSAMVNVGCAVKQLFGR